MTTNLYLRKKQLVDEMLLETQGQLQAIQTEDVDSFVHRVERCERIIQLIDEIDRQLPAASREEEREIQDTFEQIISVRAQIAPLLAPLQSKLQRQAVNEKNQTIVKQGYEEHEWYQPSIFFDQKK
ncbi:flagellar protein FliT [Aneurinibacillus sp. BA2021]|nr:flagellar protein FliT [Aneurinibacillus sp. BA2021]